MKVLMICSGLVPGGKERQLIEVIKNINKEEYEVGIITFNANQHYTEQAKTYSSYFCELRKRPTRLEPFFSIWNCFVEFKPDLVHTWDTISSLYSYLPCKVLRIPIIDGSIRDAGIDKGMFKRLKILFLKRANLAIGNSEAGMKAYGAKGKVIYNIINEERFKEPIPTNEFNLVMTANFTDYKDHTTFLKAALALVQEQIVDNVFFLGHGPHKEKHTTRLLNDYPELFDHFHFVGSVRNVEDYLSICRIGVLCSTPEFSEGLSNSVLEYMAAGLVPIVTNLGGSSEIVENGVSGYLVKAGDDKKIVELVKLLKENPIVRQQISLNARQVIREKFSLKNNLSQLTSSYRAVINSKNKG